MLWTVPTWAVSRDLDGLLLAPRDINRSFLSVSTSRSSLLACGNSVTLPWISVLSRRCEAAMWPRPMYPVRAAMRPRSD